MYKKEKNFKSIKLFHLSHKEFPSKTLYFPKGCDFVKFIPIGNKHISYENLDDVRQDHDTGTPRHIPSYYETAKKAKKAKKK